MYRKENDVVESTLMKFRVFPRIRALAIVGAVAVMCSACSSEAPPVRSDRISALALRASPAAYAMFQGELDRTRITNDFTRRAKDPENYDVYITETSDEFLFAFVMKPEGGERILDGRSVYAVSKKDGVATIRSML
jgi:hypothetical protein